MFKEKDMTEHVVNSYHNQLLSSSSSLSSSFIVLWLKSHTSSYWLSFLPHWQALIPLVRQPVLGLEQGQGQVDIMSGLLLLLSSLHFWDFGQAELWYFWPDLLTRCTLKVALCLSVNLSKSPNLNTLVVSHYLTSGMSLTSMARMSDIRTLYCTV